jgi:zinc transporter ZupT
MLVSNLFITVLLASTLACIVTTLGIYVISKYEAWGRRNAAYFMSFAAGVLISVSFLHIIPTSFGMHEQSPLFLLAGFLGLYVFNRFLRAYTCQEYRSETAIIGLIPMVGIGLHSFIDGIIYSVTFNVSVFTGLLAATGMVLHEFPEGIVTFLLLERGGFGRRKSTLYALLAAALSTPLGTLVSYPFIDRIARPTLGILLAVSAGALVYVGATHLLPEVEKENRQHTLIALVVGVLVAIVIVLSKK